MSNQISENQTHSRTGSGKRLVWDLPLRIFHWLFGLSIIAAWITAEWGEEQIHMWIGYLILGLLIFRICWGIWGTRHSQFIHFIPGPKRILSYAKSMLGGTSKESVGHNPIGSLMVVAMILLVGLQAITGLFTEGEIWAGPYSSALDSSMGNKLESLHHSNFDYILVLIAIHITAVFFYLFKKKQNLILPMILGRKDASVVPEKEHIKHSRLWIALITLMAVSGFVYWLVFVAPPPVEYDYYY